MDVTEKPSGTVIPSPSGAGAQPTSEVNERLKRFVGADGGVDSSKLAPAYLELESVVGTQTHKLSALEKAYSALASRLETSSPAPAVAAPSTEEELEAMMREPKGFVRETVNSEIKPVAVAIQVALLEMEHPELKDAKFKEGLKDFISTLPVGMKSAFEDYETARFIIRMYKEQSGVKPNGSAQEVPHSESPSASAGAQIAGPVYSRTEVLKMMRERPDEYAKIADDVTKAYTEGRIKP